MTIVRGTSNPSSTHYEPSDIKPKRLRRTQVSSTARKQGNQFTTKAEATSEDVPADGKRFTISELAAIAECRNMSTDQFTTLVIHNDYTEEEFMQWLDDRITATASKDVPVVPDEYPDAVKMDGESLAPEYKGNKGEYKVLTKQ